MNEKIEEFLQTPRLAILQYHAGSPAPRGVPVWYDWDGEVVRMFSAATSPKVDRLRRNPNASVLLTNHLGEPEFWVAFDGRIEIAPFEAAEWQPLIDRVAPRYWDLSKPEPRATIDQWRSAPEMFASLVLTPETIRSGS